jgi:hypothetical protein
MKIDFEFEKKKWWKDSDSEIREKLLKEILSNSKLIDFLENLSNPPGGELVKIKKCEFVGNFIYLCFENRIQTTNQLVEKELIFLRNEKSSEGKCLLSVKLGNKKIVISNQGESITTFFPNFGREKLCNFPKKIEKELDKTFGLLGWSVEKIIDLGTINPFIEISPEKIPVFWVELKVQKIEDENNLYMKEYNDLSELFTKFDDAIVLSIIGRKLKN